MSRKYVCSFHLCFLFVFSHFLFSRLHSVQVSFPFRMSDANNVERSESLYMALIWSSVQKLCNFKCKYGNKLLISCLSSAVATKWH